MSSRPAYGGPHQLYHRHLLDKLLVYEPPIAVYARFPPEPLNLAFIQRELKLVYLFPRDLGHGAATSPFFKDIKSLIELI
jgi:hypothetical protein